MKTMKKSFIVAMAMLGFVGFGISNFANAAGGFELGYISNVDRGSAPADGSSGIVLTVRAQTYNCDAPDPMNETRVNPSNCVGGHGQPALVGISSQPVSVQMPGGTVSPASATTDGNGYATFTLRSSAVGSKTVSIYGPTGPGPAVLAATRTVTFVSPAPVSTPSASSNSSAAPTTPAGGSQARANAPAGPTTPTTASATAPAASAAPEISGVKANDLNLDPNAPADKLPILPHGKDFNISGKTTPNTDITVYVFSEPKMFKTRSDADGNWSVTVSNLPEGQHHAELEVTDPATGQAKPRVQLGAFKVEQAKGAETVAKTTASIGKSSNKTPLIASGAIILLALLAVGGYVLYRKKLRKL